MACSWLPCDAFHLRKPDTLVVRARLGDRERLVEDAPEITTLRTTIELSPSTGPSVARRTRRSARLAVWSWRMDDRRRHEDAATDEFTLRKGQLL